jgi:hypothetical protein
MTEYSIREAVRIVSASRGSNLSATKVAKNESLYIAKFAALLCGNQGIPHPGR